MHQDHFLGDFGGVGGLLRSELTDAASASAEAIEAIIAHLRSIAPK
jgi:hypothetical protein